MNYHRGNKSNVTHNNRINILIAIVFLFGLLIIGRLFVLQVLRHGFYLTEANNQQQTETTLIPDRGKIYLADDQGGAGGETLYPLATNRQFALLYAIPCDIKNQAEAQDIAGKLFFVFDQAAADQQVDDGFAQSDQAELAAELAPTAGLPAAEKKTQTDQITHDYNLLHSDKTWVELRAKKREEAIDNIKQTKIAAYLEILGRRDSRYAPLEKKVSLDDLARFYSLFPDPDGQQISYDKLTVKNGKVYEELPGNGEREIHPDGIYHSPQSFRYYPENDVASQLLGFVRSDNDIMTGNYGLEGFFDKELSGTAGYLKSDISAGSNVNILNGQQYVKPKNGSDLILTINRSIEFYACEQLKEAARLHKSDSASLVAVDPKTGAIIAMCSWPDFDPNNYQNETDLAVFNDPVVFQQYEPGSVFKAVTMAAALNEGKVTPDTTYEDKGFVMEKGWKQPIKNAEAGAHGVVTMTYVLEESLNTGAIFAMQQIGAPTFAKYVQAFGFGVRSGVELESESSGNINNLLVKRINDLDADTASFGQGISVTPLQMLMAYAAIANGGTLMKPFVVKDIVDDSGNHSETKPEIVRQVISDKAANLLVGMLISDVESGNSQKTKIPGYYVAGKTGTAQIPEKGGYSEATIHTFIGFAPADNPKFVMLVKFDNPKDFPYADYTATPLFKTVADFMLQYYQVAKER
ncbi:MAG TPA: penicillin-binding protein 2 [Candidatus Nanoarchaeia archaeon]|nr:penicillin-binding protein 2 [Candidatus Nanoarchaeia archaeon]